MKRQLLFIVAISLFSSFSSASDVESQCLEDLEAIPAFLAENDPGVRDMIALRGESFLARGLEKAKAAALQTSDAEACQKTLNGYLRQLRNGHLWATSANWNPASKGNKSDATSVADASSRLPTIKLLSDQTVLLTISSFLDEYRTPLVELLRDNHDELVSRSNWIIDVRNNNGGGDSSYAPLLPWLVAEERLEVSPEWLVTPANIEAQERVCPRHMPQDKTCQIRMSELIRRMRATKPGSYVPTSDKVPDGIGYWRVAHPEHRRPARVAVLIDRQCGSSCEQFLLTVRQSFSVKLLGRRTFGALDYSNLRPYQLPSAQRALWYATSRSKRIPHFPVDIVGVTPDIYLPEPADEAARAQEVIRVQRWLEGGSLKPKPCC